MSEPNPTPATPTSTPPSRRASTTSYVVVLVIMVATGTFAFSKGTEPMGRRDLPGWVLGCISLFVIVVVSYFLWKRSRGEHSSLEDV